MVHAPVPPSSLPALHTPHCAARDPAAARRFLCRNVQIIGYSRTALTDEELRARLRPTLAGDIAEKELFLSRCTYVAGDYDSTGAGAAGFQRLAEALAAREVETPCSPTGRLFYLALPPVVYPQVCEPLCSRARSVAAVHEARILRGTPCGQNSPWLQQQACCQAGLPPGQARARIDLHVRSLERRRAILRFWSAGVQRPEDILRQRQQPARLLDPSRGGETFRTVSTGSVAGPWHSVGTSAVPRRAKPKPTAPRCLRPAANRALQGAAIAWPAQGPGFLGEAGARAGGSVSGGAAVSHRPLPGGRCSWLRRTTPHCLCLPPCFAAEDPAWPSGCKGCLMEQGLSDGAPCSTRHCLCPAAHPYSLTASCLLAGQGDDAEYAGHALQQRHAQQNVGPHQHC